jgi:hypothetical protein
LGIRQPNSSLKRQFDAGAIIGGLVFWLSSDHREEENVYRACGLSFVEPELREGRGEIELAARGALPVLVAVADIRGELHAHSTSSDGRNTA